MTTRSIAFKFSAEGNTALVNDLKELGKQFDANLKQAQDYANKQLEATKKAFSVGDINAYNEALKKGEAAAKSANKAIADSYRELGVRSSASLEAQKNSAIAAFNAIKNSGVASTRDLAKAQEALDNKLEQLNNQLGKVKTSAERMGEGFTVAKGAVASFIATASLQAINALNNSLQSLVGNVIQTGATLDRQKAAFETFLGSAEKANKMLSDVRNFAATTPFELPEVTDAAKQLLAAGVAADDVIESIRRLGEIAAGADKPLGQLLFVYTQVKNQGRIFGQDLNQLMNAGLSMEDFARALGVGKEEVKKLVSEGKVGFPELEKVIKGVTSEGGRFSGLMDKLSNTNAVKLSNLNDAFTKIYLTIYDAIGPALGAVLDSIVALLNPLGENKALFEDLKKTSQEFADYLKQNPDLVKDLGLILQQVILVSVKAIAEVVRSWLEFFKQNRVAINGIASGLKTISEVSYNIGKMWNDTVFQGVNIVYGVIKDMWELLKKPLDGNSWVNLFTGRNQQLGGITPTPTERTGTGGRGVSPSILKVPYLPPNTQGSPPPAPPSGAMSAAPKKISEDAEFAATVIAVANKHKINPMDLMSIILFESGGSASITNSIGATGLIQFMPETAKGLGTSTKALRKMDKVAQMKYVDKYLGQWNWDDPKLENLYASILAGDPKKINAMDSNGTTAANAAPKMRKQFYSQAASMLAKADGIGEGIALDFNRSQDAQQAAQQAAEEAKRKAEAEAKALESIQKTNLTLKQQIELSQQTTELATKTLQVNQDYANKVAEINAQLKDANASQKAALQEQLTLQTQIKDAALERITAETQAAAANRFGTQAGELGGGTIARAMAFNVALEQAIAANKPVNPWQQWIDGANELTGTIAGGLTNAINGFANGTMTAKTAFMGFVQNVLQGIAQIASQIVTSQIMGFFKNILGGFLGGGGGGAGGGIGSFVGSLFGGGFATGGYVSGPGTSTSDSILARLSAGEFVISSAAVDHWGAGTFEAMNAAPRFASGGLVSASPARVGGSTIINMSVTTPDANSFRKSENQVGRDLAEMADRARRRNG